ncbi:MAG TPA: hypothetical protein VLS25_09280 [Dehalococcoidia bacterium]|nr:hypothetical protein [Dehalococcoidia bacterium]
MGATKGRQLMRALQTAFAVAMIAVISLACGRDEEAAAPAPTFSPTPLSPSSAPAVKGQLWRWVNVTVVIPDGSEVQASPQDASPDLKPPSGGRALQLVREDPSAGTISSVIIDAETGAILLKEVLDKDRPAIEDVLATVAVAPLDPLTAPWPYTGSAPDEAVERLGNLQFVRPDPASGIQLYQGVSDSFGPSPVALEYLRITNGRSTAIVDLNTGARLEHNETIVADDGPAFERLVAAMSVCGKDAKC